MNGLRLVYFYIDVMKDEIKEEEAESLKDTFDLSKWGRGLELVQMKKALLRFEQIATQLEGDRAEQTTQECIEKLRAASHGKEN